MSSTRWQAGGQKLELPLVMGVLNVTPDSFSDGGRYLDAAAAVDRGVEMWEQGAGLVDVGGESTRPGSAGVSAAEELARVVPVVTGLAARGVAVSVDTSKADVAAAALDAGAIVVNDVTALGDPDMAGVVADAGAGLVLMHMKGTPASMQDDPVYGDVVTEVREYLEERAARAARAGIAAGHICIDPGIGFGKTAAHNLELLGRLPELVETGHPVMVGVSRKRFLAAAGYREEDRDEATAVLSGWCVAAGAAAVRVHDVARSLRAVRLLSAIVRPRMGSEV